MPVASVADLIAVKRAAGRPKDQIGVGVPQALEADSEKMERLTTQMYDALRHVDDRPDELIGEAARRNVSR